MRSPSIGTSPLRPRLLARVAGPVAGLVALTVGLSLGIAGPPGVPHLETEPTAAPESTAPAAESTAEEVLILDRRKIDDTAIVPFLEQQRPDHLAVLEDWIVLADAPARMTMLRTELAALLARGTGSWRIEARIVQLDPDSAETPDAIAAVRREPDGDVAAALFEGTHPAIKSTLAAPRVLVRDGDPAEVRLEGDGEPTVRWVVEASGADGGEVEIRTDLEVARRRTLGRRIDRHGSRASDRRRRVAIDRPVAITTAAFADTSVRELDGGFRTLPRVADPDEPPVILVLDAVAVDGPVPLPAATYRRGDATRDGIGLYHFDREIAQVMGHLGAGWLERPEREREERTSHLLSMLGITPGMTVADIGAGSGYFTRRLSPMVGETGRVVATDIQPEMLAILEQGLAAEGITNVESVLGRVDDCGLPPESVDLILLVDVYHEFDHPWEMARSMRRALRPGGRVALVEYRANDPAVPIKPLHTMTAAQSRLEFEAAGYRLVETREDGLPWQRLQLFERPADPNAATPR